MKDKPILAGFVGAALFAGVAFSLFFIYVNRKTTGKPAYVPPTNTDSTEKK